MGCQILNGQDLRVKIELTLAWREKKPIHEAPLVVVECTVQFLTAHWLIFPITWNLTAFFLKIEYK